MEDFLPCKPELFWLNLIRLNSHILWKLFFTYQGLGNNCRGRSSLLVWSLRAESLDDSFLHAPGNSMIKVRGEHRHILPAKLLECLYNQKCRAIPAHIHCLNFRIGSYHVLGYLICIGYLSKTPDRNYVNIRITVLDYPLSGVIPDSCSIECRTMNSETCLFFSCSPCSIPPAFFPCSFHSPTHLLIHRTHSCSWTCHPEHCL